MRRCGGASAFPPACTGVRRGSLRPPGSKKGQPLLYNGLTDSNGALIVDYYDITLPYPMALAIIFACDSNSGMNVLASLSPNSISLGFSGTLYPFSPWNYVSDVIKPSDQGTNGED